MANPNGKAIIILSEARSGSNWLAALMLANRGWGQCREWLNPAVHQLPRHKRLSADTLMALLARAAISPATNVLGLKVFTHQLMRFHALYGFDPIARASEGRDTLYLRLERRDRVAQAVSLEMARQSGAWKSTSAIRAEPRYDFARILRAYVKIDASYAFWDSYCRLRGLNSQLFHYEDLLEDPTPWLAACASFTGRPKRKDQPGTGRLQVQRDARNAEWAAQFRQDLAGADVLRGLYPAPPSLPRRLLERANTLRAGHGPARQFDL